MSDFKLPVVPELPSDKEIEAACTEIHRVLDHTKPHGTVVDCPVVDSKKMEMIKENLCHYTMPLHSLATKQNEALRVLFAQECPYKYSSFECSRNALNACAVCNAKNKAQQILEQK